MPVGVSDATRQAARGKFQIAKQTNSDHRPCECRVTAGANGWANNHLPKLPINTYPDRCRGQGESPKISSRQDNMVSNLTQVFNKSNYSPIQIEWFKQNQMQQAMKII
jgi:hypothetical protein